MKKRVPCFLCAVVLATAAALAPAQKSHDALARARDKAKAENQRVLLYVSGGDAAVDAALRKSMANYRQLGKQLKYEYQVAALPATSLAATHLRKTLGLADYALPILAALDTEDRLLAAVGADAIATEGEFKLAAVTEFLGKFVCTPLDARKVLEDGITEAKKSKRQVFVYLSAPW